jgi:hypothetical protein
VEGVRFQDSECSCMKNALRLPHPHLPTHILKLLGYENFRRANSILSSSSRFPGQGRSKASSAGKHHPASSLRTPFRGCGNLPSVVVASGPNLKGAAWQSRKKASARLNILISKLDCRASSMLAMTNLENNSFDVPNDEFAHRLGNYLIGIN